MDCYSPEETLRCAKEFAASLKSGDIVRLFGEIGVGKTVFVRGIADFFQCGEEVCSPTFTILNIYEGEKTLYHFDLYRLEQEEEIYEAGLYEFLEGNGISIVEWPQLLREYPDARIFDVTIEKNLDISENYRKITFIGERED